MQEVADDFMQLSQACWVRSSHWLMYAQHEEGIPKSELPENGPDFLTKSLTVLTLRDTPARQRRGGFVCVCVFVYKDRFPWVAWRLCTLFMLGFILPRQSCCAFFGLRLGRRKRQAMLFGLEAGKSIYQLKIWLNSPTHK